MNKKVKWKIKDMRMNISNIISLRTKQIILIHTNNTFILSLTKKKKINQ